jgi:hypothetical protein
MVVLCSFGFSGLRACLFPGSPGAGAACRQFSLYFGLALAEFGVAPPIEYSSRRRFIVGIQPHLAGWLDLLGLAALGTAVASADRGDRAPLCALWLIQGLGKGRELVLSGFFAGNCRYRCLFLRYQSDSGLATGDAGGAGNAATDFSGGGGADADEPGSGLGDRVGHLFVGGGLHSAAVKATPPLGFRRGGFEYAAGGWIILAGCCQLLAKSAAAKGYDWIFPNATADSQRRSQGKITVDSERIRIFRYH